MKKAIKLIDMLVGNKNGGHLSQYSVMIEINQIPHWTLSDCLEPFLRQKQNLTTLLTISGTFAFLVSCFEIHFRKIIRLFKAFESHWSIKERRIGTNKKI